MLNLHKFNNLIPQVRVSPILEINDSLDNLLHRVLVKRKILVIGGAGSIGASTLLKILSYVPSVVHVVDRDENALARMIRRMRVGGHVNEKTDILTFPTDYASDIFINWLFSTGIEYDYILNFSALKHVRSEKDPYTCAAIIENNVTKFYRFLQAVNLKKTKRVFSVSTDKAANSTSIMGISKKLMERVMFSEHLSDGIIFSSARFANVAFSQGSLLENWIERIGNFEPLSCPIDCHRYFITMEEAGFICLVAAFLTSSKDIVVPSFSKEGDLVELQLLLEQILSNYNYKPKYFENETELLDWSNSNSFSGNWPVLLTPLDTKGEKPFEEFVGKNEIVSDGDFDNLKIVHHDSVLKTDECLKLIESFENLFRSKALNFNAIVKIISKYEPNFVNSRPSSRHNLDDRI